MRSVLTPTRRARLDLPEPQLFIQVASVGRADSAANALGGIISSDPVAGNVFGIQGPRGRYRASLPSAFVSGNAAVAGRANVAAGCIQPDWDPGDATWSVSFANVACTCIQPTETHNRTVSVGRADCSAGTSAPQVGSGAATVYTNPPFVAGRYRFARHGARLSPAQFASPGGANVTCGGLQPGWDPGDAYWGVPSANVACGALTPSTGEEVTTTVGLIPSIHSPLAVYAPFVKSLTYAQTKVLVGRADSTASGLSPGSSLPTLGVANATAGANAAWVSSQEAIMSLADATAACLQPSAIEDTRKESVGRAISSCGALQPPTVDRTYTVSMLNRYAQSTAGCIRPVGFNEGETQTGNVNNAQCVCRGVSVYWVGEGSTIEGEVIFDTFLNIEIVEDTFLNQELEKTTYL